MKLEKKTNKTKQKKTPHLSRLLQNTHHILIRGKPLLLPQVSLFILLTPSFRALQCFLRPLWKPLLLLVGWLSSLCGRTKIYIYHERRRMLPIAAVRLDNEAEVDSSWISSSERFLKGFVDVVQKLSNRIKFFVLEDLGIACFFCLISVHQCRGNKCIAF